MYMKKYFTDGFFFLVFFTLSLSTVQAFGAGPTSINVNPLPPDHSKEITVVATRSYKGPKENILVEIDGSLSNLVQIKSGTPLYFEAGLDRREIPLVFRASANQMGAHKGEIKIKQADVQNNGDAAANAVVIPIAVNITVDSDETKLLSVTNSDYRWSSNTNEVLMRFHANNERTYDSGIAKVVLSIEKNEKAPIELEMPVNNALLKSEKDGDYNLNIPIGAGEYGIWEISAQFFDEKGTLISAPIMQTVVVNPERAAHMQRVHYFVYVIVAALAVAALFMGDYYYLRKKYGAARR